MDKIVIIGANNFQNPLIEKAKELGYETHVFAWRDGSIGEKTADYFYPISIIEKEKILEECRKIAPTAVVTIASDLAAITVSYVANQLQLTANSAECILKTTNKYFMRSALKAAKIPVPEFHHVDMGTYGKQIKNMKFPVIVKPTDRSGSRSITKINSLEEAKPAVARAVADSFEKKAIVEEYLEGDEYSLEAISHNGKHTFLAITKKQTTGAPHYIETGHMQPAKLTNAQEEKIKTEIEKALNALEIATGASHSEFRLDKNDNVNIIEIGARMGGDCIGSHLVSLSTGYDFLEMVIDAATGKPPGLVKKSIPKKAAIKFILDREDLEEYHNMKEKYPDYIQYESEIDDLGMHKVIDSSSRYGYYIMAWDKTDDCYYSQPCCL